MLSPYRENFQYLNLLETDLAQFYPIYLLIQRTDQEGIDLQKMTSYFQLEDSQFGQKLLQQHQIVTIFDMILIIWQLCTIGKYLGIVQLLSLSPPYPLHISTSYILTFSFLALYVYDLYTPKGQVLNVVKCDAMIKEIFGKKYDKTNSAIKLNRELQRLGKKGGIHSWLFQEFATQHSFILSPCASIQKNMMDIVLGRSRWAKLTQLRIKRERGHYKSFQDIKEDLNLDPKARKRHDKVRERVRSQHYQGKDKPDHDSLSINSSSSETISSPNKGGLLLSWYRDIGEALNLLDNRTVIVKPLPPIEAPETIKSLNTYNIFSQQQQPHHLRASGGLSEVKYLTKPSSLVTGGSNDNSMILEDFE